MKEKNKLEEIKDKIKRGTAVVTASAVLTAPGMLKANGFKRNIENPYAAPVYFDIDLPKDSDTFASIPATKSFPIISKSWFLPLPFPGNTVLASGVHEITPFVS